MIKIESERTSLRRLKITDIENMQALETDPFVMKITPSRIPQSREQTLKRMEAQIARQNNLEPFGIWVADLKADSSFVGWFMLMPTENKQLELGFMLVRDQWNKGLGTEVCQTLIDFVRSQSKIELITADTNVENIRSMRTLEKLGFNYVKSISVSEKVFGGQIQLKVFSLKIR